MQEMTLDEIHAAELGVLKEVDKICREIGVKYWLLFGTLIGAVREHGFIPWDDDLDIGMKRDDYEKLISYFTQKGGGHNLHLDHFLTVENYPNYIARVSETKNYVKFRSGRYKSGVFIDIYPMDGLEGLQWLTNWRHKIMEALALDFLLDYKLFPIKGRNLRRKILFTIFMLSRKFLRKIMGLKRKQKFCYEALTKLAKKYKFDDSEYVGIPSWSQGSCWKRESFDEIIYLKFEDFEAPSPAGYDEILKFSYGDYMQRPPEDERKPHHNYIAYKNENL